MAWTAPRTWADSPTRDHNQANYQPHITDNLKWVVRPVYVASGDLDITNLEYVPHDLFATTLPEPVGYTGTAIVPANYMGTSGCLRGTIIGDYDNETGTASAWDVALKFGTTTIWEDHSDNIDAGGNRHDWRIRFYIANLNSALIQFAVGSFTFSEQSNMTALGEAGVGPLNDPVMFRNGPFVVPFGSDSTVAIDTTTDQPVTFTLRHAQNALLSFRRFWGSLELIGQAA